MTLTLRMRTWIASAMMIGGGLAGCMGALDREPSLRDYLLTEGELPNGTRLAPFAERAADYEIAENPGKLKKVAIENKWPPGQAVPEEVWIEIIANDLVGSGADRTYIIYATRYATEDDASSLTRQGCPVSFGGGVDALFREGSVVVSIGPLEGMPGNAMGDNVTAALEAKSPSLYKVCTN